MSPQDPCWSPCIGRCVGQRGCFCPLPAQLTAAGCQLLKLSSTSGSSTKQTQREAVTTWSQPSSVQAPHTFRVRRLPTSPLWEALQSKQCNTTLAPCLTITIQTINKQTLGRPGAAMLANVSFHSVFSRSRKNHLVLTA